MGNELKSSVETFFNSAAAEINRLEAAIEDVKVFPGSERPRILPEHVARHLHRLPAASALAEAMHQRRHGRPTLNLFPEVFGSGAVTVGMQAIHWFLRNNDLLMNPRRIITHKEFLVDTFVNAAEEKPRVTGCAFLLGLRMPQEAAILESRSGWSIRCANPDDLQRVELATDTLQGVFARMPILSVVLESTVFFTADFERQLQDLKRSASESCWRTLQRIRSIPDMEIDAPLMMAYCADPFVNPAPVCVEEHKVLEERILEVECDFLSEEDPTELAILESELEQLAEREVPTLELTADVFSVIESHVEAFEKLLAPRITGHERKKNRLRVALDRWSKAVCKIEIETREYQSLTEKYPSFEAWDENLEPILLDLVIALEALLGSDSREGEQDRLKRRVVQLVSPAFGEPLDLWDWLREIWNARNRIVHGEDIEMAKMPRARTDIRKLRRVVSWSIIRLLEIASENGPAAAPTHSNWQLDVLRMLDQAAIDPNVNLRVAAINHPKICRPGTLRQEWWRPGP